MALAHKGLEATRVPLRFADKDKIAFSGQSLVPVLVDGGHVITDSWRIAQHLEEHYATQPSLFGEAGALAVTRFVNAWADTLVPLFARVIVLDVYRCLDEEDKTYFRASREKIFGMSLEATVADRPNHLLALRQALRPLRHTLKKQVFIGGEIPAYADYCVFGMFMWARGCSATEILEADDPLVLWRDRLLDAFGGLARSAPTVQSPSA